jgi:hypothetical protein
MLSRLCTLTMCLVPGLVCPGAPPARRPPSDESGSEDDFSDEDDMTDDDDDDDGYDVEDDDGMSLLLPHPPGQAYVQPERGYMN